MRITLLEKLAKSGTAFTINDAIASSNMGKEIVWVLLSRLERRGWIERIERGKYVIVPLSSEKGDFTLHEFVIGSLLVHPYCIAYWSALNHYGMTEQFPRTVFIQTTMQKWNRTPKIFGVNFKIIRVNELKFFAKRSEWIDDSEVIITDKEKTVIDCLDKPHLCGGVLEVMKGLKNVKIRNEIIVEYAKRIGNTGVLRRLGFISDYLGLNIPVPQVETRNYLYLDPTLPHAGDKSGKWRIINNMKPLLAGELE